MKPFKKCKPPILCLSYFVANVVLYYFVPMDKNKYCPQIPPSRQEDEWWKYVVSTFLHFSELHLWTNMTLLLILGLLFEMIYGSIPFFLVSFVGGVTGLLYEQALYYLDGNKYLLGSSSVVYALGGSFLSTLLIKSKEMGSVLTTLCCIAVIVLISNTLVESTILRVRGVAHVAHASSFLQGFLVNISHLKLFAHERKYDAFIFFASLLLSGIVIVACIPIYLVHPFST